MLRSLYRLLPPAERRRLVTLTLWLTAAAIAQGVALGLVGAVVAALLDPARRPVPWSVALGAAVVAYLLVQWIAQMIAFQVGAGTARALHVRLGEHLAALPLGWFTPSRQAGVIDLATGGIPQIMSYPALLLRPAVSALVTPVAAALTVAVLDWRLAAAILCATALAWWTSRLSARLARTIDARHHVVTAEVNRRILEYADRQPVIRTDQRPDDTAALDLALADAYDAARRAAGTVTPGLVLFSVTLNAAFAAVIGLGVLRVSGAGLEVPVLLGVLVVASRLVAVAAAGADLAAGLRLQAGIIERLAATLSEQPLPAVPTGAGGDADKALVRVEHISFAYDTTPVLQDITFTLPRRGLTAVVGASGSGKTTLARLLARFWDPSAGRIVLDGTDLRSLTMPQLAGYLATVLQDDYLLDTTIGENIRLGRPAATPDEVAEAVRVSGLDGFIAELPEGLDTPAGPGGACLSGGQRQRICVARALLKAAPLTLLDEATSALDPANARLIAAAAGRLARQGSVLVIAHNLETVARADQILVLDGGRLRQLGSHAELLGRPGVYRDLLRHSSLINGSDRVEVELPADGAAHPAATPRPS